MRRSILRSLLISSLLLTVITPLRAQVRSLGLSEIVQSAGSSFIGTVTNVRYGYDARHNIVTYTTFHVEQNVAGTSGKTVTMKQLGGILDGLDTRLEHLRYFQPGERVLVSMYGASSMGFSNPVGLDQGVWRVADDRVLDVKPSQLQGLDAALKQHGIATSIAHGSQPQPISKANFVALMRSLAVAKKGADAR